MPKMTGARFLAESVHGFGITHIHDDTQEYDYTHIPQGAKKNDIQDFDAVAKFFEDNQANATNSSDPTQIEVDSTSEILKTLKPEK